MKLFLNGKDNSVVFKSEEDNPTIYFKSSAIYMKDIEKSGKSY